MNAPRCDELDYIQFLVAAQDTFTCTEAARCQLDAPDAPAYDAFTRLLSWTSPWWVWPCARHQSALPR